MNQIAFNLYSFVLQSPIFRLADSALNNICEGARVGNGHGACKPKADLTSPLTGNVKTITDALLTVAGAVAVIIIIIAGIRYITSTGDSTRIQQAKDTLLYAVIGLVVVIVAFAIVNFVGGIFK